MHDVPDLFPAPSSFPSYKSFCYKILHLPEAATAESGLFLERGDAGTLQPLLTLILRDTGHQVLIWHELMW